MTDITTPATPSPPAVPEAVQDWVQDQHAKAVEYDRMRAMIDQYETRHAVLVDQIESCRSALIETSAKADYYMRLNAELNQIFGNMVALANEAAKARAHVGRPNGAAPQAAAGSDEVPRFLLQPLGEPK